MRGIPNDSFLPLDRNVAINVELFLYGNAARTQEEVKINATASVLVHVPCLNTQETVVNYTLTNSGANRVESTMFAK